MTGYDVLAEIFLRRGGFGLEAKAEANANAEEYEEGTADEAVASLSSGATFGSWIHGVLLASGCCEYRRVYLQETMAKSLWDKGFGICAIVSRSVATKVD